MSFGVLGWFLVVISVLWGRSLCSYMRCLCFWGVVVSFGSFGWAFVGVLGWFLCCVGGVSFVWFIIVWSWTMSIRFVFDFRPNWCFFFDDF